MKFRCNFHLLRRRGEKPHSSSKKSEGSAALYPKALPRNIALQSAGTPRIFHKTQVKPSQCPGQTRRTNACNVRQIRWRSSAFEKIFPPLNKETSRWTIMINRLPVCQALYGKEPEGPVPASILYEILVRAGTGSGLPNFAKQAQVAAMPKLSCSASTFVRLRECLLGIACTRLAHLLELAVNMSRWRHCI